MPGDRGSVGLLWLCTNAVTRGPLWTSITITVTVHYKEFIDNMFFPDLACLQLRHPGPDTTNNSPEDKQVTINQGKITRLLGPRNLGTRVTAAGLRAELTERSRCLSQEGRP